MEPTELLRMMLPVPVARLAQGQRSRAVTSSPPASRTTAVSDTGATMREWISWRQPVVAPTRR